MNAKIAEISIPVRGAKIATKLTAYTSLVKLAQPLRLGGFRLRSIEVMER